MIRVMRAGIAVIICVVVLAACYKGEVKKKDADRNGAPHILVDDGNRERWVKVDKDTFERCRVGEWYEDNACGPRPEMRNIPVEKDKQGRRQRKQWEVCVDATSIPAAKLTFTYAIGAERKNKETYITDRFGPRCRMAESGQRVSITVEHHTNPSIVHCRAYRYEGGKEVLIEEAWTENNLADCKVNEEVW